jgi:hypothetical protein
MAYIRAVLHARSMKVDVSTELDCSAVKAWNEVQKSSLLLHVIRPLARIVSVDGRGFPERWTEGLMIQCRSYLFGFIPVGVRNLYFQRIDHVNFEILILENDPLVKSWKHAISIKPLGQDRSIYRDVIDIDAGRLTALVWAWADWFYRHRHAAGARSQSACEHYYAS